MRYRILAMIFGFLGIITASCGYHLHSITAQIPNNLKTIILNSYDPYGPLTRTICTELRLHDIVIDDTKTKDNTLLPSVHIVKSSENQITTLVFQDGKSAEYQLVFSVQAKVSIPEKNCYPIDVKVYRSFFSNPLSALAQDSKKDIIRQEMRQQAAEYLVRKLLIILQKTDKKVTYEKSLCQQKLIAVC